jgi:hypothetical protein
MNTFCEACNKVGMMHCSDPVNCGNMEIDKKQMTEDQTKYNKDETE